MLPLDEIRGKAMFTVESCRKQVFKLSKKGICRKLFKKMNAKARKKRQRIESNLKKREAKVDLRKDIQNVKKSFL